MEKERERVRADLLGQLEGEVLCDDLSLQLYASDASIFEMRPLAAVRPRTVADIVAVVNYCNEHGFTIHPRGAGSSVGGESLGTGIVLDMSRYFTRLTFNESRPETVRVQAGVVLADLNRRLASVKRIFGPDPATRSVTTMGSVVAVNASGSLWLRHRATRQHIRAVQCVLATGEVVELSRHSLTGDGSTNDGTVDIAWHLGRKVASICERYRDSIEQARPRTLVDPPGYQLHDLVSDGQVDLAKLMCGSEGTLGIITEATLETSPWVAKRGVVLLFFSRLDTAAKAALDIAKLGADACDLMDRRLLSIARETDEEYAQLIPPDAEAMLLVEFSGDNATELNKRILDISAKIRRRYRESFDHQVTLEVHQRNRFWRLTRRVIPTLYRLKGSHRAIPFIEDIAVPPEALPEYLVTAQNIFKQHQVTASIFAHAGHGQLHMRPFVDIADTRMMSSLQLLADSLYTEALKVGGCAGAEHGLGVSRTWFSRQQFGAAYGAMVAVKQLFDPGRRLNPGKVIGDDSGDALRALRSVRSKVRYQGGEDDAPSEEALDSSVDNSSVSTGSMDSSDTDNRSGSFSALGSLPVIEVNGVWRPDELTLAARTCNGCGRCRTQGSDERMCPVFRADTREEASPRAKANLMRAVATGQLSPETMATPEFKKVADLCFNCHQCRIDCPASVDIPKLMMEAKSQFVARNGLSPSDLAFARIDTFFAWASRFAPQANWLVRRRWVRWMLEKGFGISSKRPLPRFQKRSFLRDAERRGLSTPTRRTSRRVVYFVDSFANWCDTELAWCVVQVLEHQGVTVYVPNKQRVSGMSLISCGALDRARPLVEANVELLAECVRQGYDIVCSEPAATLALKHEYPNLIDDADASLVASRTFDIGAYLMELKREEQFELNLRPLNYTLAYHLPCHQRALYGGSPSLDLLTLVSGLQVRPVEKGCSGMAGLWGMKRENYRRSARIVQPLAGELRKPDYLATVSECTSCRMQVEHFSRKAAIHPIKLLAMAYGLLRDDKRLTRMLSETTA